MNHLKVPFLQNERKSVHRLPRTLLKSCPNMSFLHSLSKCLCARWNLKVFEKHNKRSMAVFHCRKNVFDTLSSRANELGNERLKINHFVDSSIRSRLCVVWWDVWSRPCCWPEMWGLWSLGIRIWLSHWSQFGRMRFLLWSVHHWWWWYLAHLMYSHFSLQNVCVSSA